MNYTLAVGLSIHQTVSLIMSAKPHHVIIEQPSTKSMNKMMEQMAQMVAPVKTTAWGGQHGLLTLVLDDTGYKSITKSTTQTTALVTQPDAINQGITDQSTQLKILTLQAETKTLQKEFDLLEAVTNIGVQRIIDCVEEQYVEELNEEYFGYANSTIMLVLHHLHTKWCKIMTRERTDATNAFYQAWVPNNKQQKKCKTINVIIFNEAKTLHFVGQMYKSDYFTDEQMTKYEILVDLDKVWEKTLTHFTDLYALCKAYGNNRAANSGFESAVQVQEIFLGHSIITTESDLTRGLYIGSLEESLVVAQEYVTKDMAAHAAAPPANEQLTLLRNNLDAQRKQFELVMEQNSKLLAALSKGGRGDGGRGGGSSGGGKNNGGVANNGGSARKGGSGGGGGGHGGGSGGNSTFREKKLFPNCNKWVVHFPAECFSLEANKNKCPAGWKAKPPA
jgi:hypothetical protein